MRILSSCGVLAAALSLAHAATLQLLSLDDMIQKSTAIVRGSVQLTGGAAHGRYIYTHYTLRVVEQWKGAPATQIDFVAPGGTANGLQESIAGSPSFVNGQEYVLFLWTSRSGLTQVIGLSQGVFVSTNGMVVRPAIMEHMIDPHGAEASDPGMQMTINDMRNRILTTLKVRP
jgi:hypothetical protein